MSRVDFLPWGALDISIICYKKCKFTSKFRNDAVSVVSLLYLNFRIENSKIKLILSVIFHGTVLDST